MLTPLHQNEWATPTFLWSWGPYYPNLGQWFSFGAGLLVLFANTVWLYCVLKYTNDTS